MIVASAKVSMCLLTYTGGTGEKSKPDSIVHLFFAGCPWLLAQTSMQPAELEQLKSIVRSQQVLLEERQAQIQALQLALAEQKQILVGILQPRIQESKQVPAATRWNANDPMAPATQTQASNSQAAPIDQLPSPYRATPPGFARHGLSSRTRLGFSGG